MNTHRLYCLVLDLGYPMDEQTLGYTLTALENILILASSSKTHSKLNSITMSTVNQDAQNLGIFPVKGDLKTIQVLIGNIRSTATRNWRLSSEEYEDFLQLAITTSMNEYKLKVKNIYGDKSGKLRIAVLSSKPGRTLGRILSSIRRRWANLKAEGAAVEVTSDMAPIQVIDTSARRSVSLGWPDQFTSDGLDCLDEDSLRPKIIVQRAATLQSIQDELKRFLMLPDPQVIKLVISADAITTSKMADAVDDSGTVVLCEGTPVTLDPSDLPASVEHNFLIPPAKNDEDKVRYEFEEPESQVTVRSLIIKSRVSYDGVCDGSTFGIPFYLSPISFETAVAMATCLGSKTNANIDENIEMFWAIHLLLTEREEVLLTTLESNDGTGGNFLIHAGGDCLLLQAIRSVELALPASNEVSGSIRKNVSAHMVARAENILDPLPRQEYYRTSKYPTGVFSHLSSVLKGNVQKSVHRKKISAAQNNMILSFVNSHKEKSSRADKK